MLLEVSDSKDDKILHVSIVQATVQKDSRHRNIPVGFFGRYVPDKRSDLHWLRRRSRVPDTKFLLPYGRQSTVVSRYGHRNRMGLKQVLLPVFAGKSPAHPLAGHTEKAQALWRPVFGVQPRTHQWAYRSPNCAQAAFVQPDFPTVPKRFLLRFLLQSC